MRKVALLGNAGGGKSTLGVKLSTSKGIPLYFTDKLQWKPGGEAIPENDENEHQCKCGAAACRKVITGQDWRRKDLQEKYKGYMSWYLIEKAKQVR